MSYTSWIDAVKSVGLDETRQVGYIWQTAAGTWAGKRGDKNKYGIKNKETAQAYVAVKDVEVDEPEAEPEKEKKPKTSDSDGQFGYTGDKDKSLKKVDTSKSKFYNEDIKPPDSKYKTPKGFEIGPPPKPFKFSEGISNGKFPKKYGTLLERMMNTKRKGKQPKITSFISGGGAGVISAQAGEVMTMMGTSMSDEEWDKTSKMLLDHIEKQGKAGGIIDKSWVEAATNNRTAINNQIKGKYPEGTVISHTGWDTEGDTNAMGWSDYKGQKGFSSDIYVKVKTPDGKESMHEVSLKKDKKINFLNSGTGKFRKWAKGTEGTKIDPKVHAKRERERLDKFGENNRAEIEKLTKTNPELQKIMKDKGFKSVDDFFPPDSRNSAKAAFTAMNVMAGYPEFGYDNDSGKVTPDPPETDAQKAVAEQIQATRQYCTDATNAIVDNKELKAGMMEEIKSEFPVKSVADGEETMAIGDMSLDKKTMTDIFGTSDFSKIQEHLTVDDSIDPPYLAYEGEAGGKRLRIARIDIRQDGLGYGGGSMRFDLNMADDFANRLEDANKNVYSEKKEQYESLEGIISRMKRP